MAFTSKRMVNTDVKSNGPERHPTLNASDAIADYCNRVAEHLKATGVDISKLAADLQQELETTADNLKQVGELERKRTSTFYARVKSAVDQLRGIRETFAQPLDQAVERSVMTGMAEQLLEHHKEEEGDPIPKFLSQPHKEIKGD